ncbi:MAG: glycosyltransferase family 2 protein [Chitinispirillaceae bacterium]|nr:glycosyltransferase family 2 protein [Chitinispirillaceae bacterium]
MKLSIVIPLKNERESLQPLADAIVKAVGPLGLDYELVFVDDGSTDGSFDAIRALKAPGAGIRIRAFRFSRNYGKSAALATGIARAEGEIIVTMDGDLQDDPAAVPDLLKKLDEGYDLVSGWKKIRHDPVTFTVPSLLWNRATSLIAGVRLHDFNCGLKAYRAAAAKSLEIYGERHRYLPVLAHWDGWRVSEIPVTHHRRRFGKSKYGFSKFFKGFLDLLTLLFLRRYLRSPLHFFGLVGFLLMAAGAAVLGYFGVQWLVTGAMRIRPLTLLSVAAIIMGIQFLSFGFLAEMLAHVSTRPRYNIRETIE